MKRSLVLNVSLLTGLALTGSWAFASGDAASPRTLRGSVVVQQADGAWKKATSFQPNQWVTAAAEGSTVKVPGATVRLQPGARVRLTRTEEHSFQMQANQGRIFVKLDEGGRCQVSTASRQVQASRGEFVMDTGSAEGLYVVDGDASASSLTPSKIAPKPRSLSNWSNSVALDGPDVRKRNNNRRRFTQGEENKGKRIGEDLPPSRTPMPSATETPAYTPTITPTITPTTPPANNPPPQITGGGEIWPVLGGLAGLGGIIYLVTRTDDGDENRVIVPSSP